MKNSALRTVAVAAVATMLFAPAAGLAYKDAEIEAAVGKIFAGRPDENFISIVIRDAPGREYLALHLSTYLDVKELRVYVVPFKNADTEAVDAALRNDEHEVAFESLISDMRVHLGARYVSDAGLNGINDQPVPLGTGSLRDNYHSKQFPSHGEADKSYRSWLQRAVVLLES